uniref:Major facilitator superfamily (MFS) profile domain-containing protein n=1 Tax=Ciona savignyi TaxID=51511 RepID=H2Z5C1_CIOSA
MGLSINGFASSGYLANIVDIAPLYAGLLFGVSNTIGSIPGFIGPLTAGIVVKDKTSVNQWQVLFWINAAVGLFGSLLFACFASGSEREWAKEEERQQCCRTISVK